MHACRASRDCDIDAVVDDNPGIGSGRSSNCRTNKLHEGPVVKSWLADLNQVHSGAGSGGNRLDGRRTGSRLTVRHEAYDGTLHARDQ
jgi:hypothetical protein